MQSTPTLTPSAGGATTDPDQRRAAYSAAIQRITDQAYFMPLFTDVTTRVYEGRHEILNGYLQAEVRADILSWLDARFN